MKKYDFVIAGGGGAGLGLASALLDSSLRQKSILVVDQEAKTQNDRTWCFWGPPTAPFADLAAHSWKFASIVSEGYRKTIDLKDWRYWMVRGIDYYAAIYRRLEETPSVSLRQGRVEKIEESETCALVSLGGEKVEAGWVFDSTLSPQDFVVDADRYHFIKQHFRGWEIETEQDCFNPACVTLFDFRTPQNDEMRFFYLLPSTARQALVEFTIFSANLLEDAEYEQGLKDYLANVLNISAYRVLSVENGVIPMTDQPFNRRASPHVMNIGTKGGLVKPSTGYAFARMQRDARAIVASLEQAGHPFNVPASPARYRLYDSLLLQILYRRGGLMKPIFLQLFERNPIRRVFAFLDESATCWQDLALIAGLPPEPFLQALVKLKISRQI